MDIFDTAAPHNDKVIVAFYTTAGDPFHDVFSFGNLKPGSPARAARCAEYDRKIEALKGQGCQVHVWSPEYWPRYRQAFYNCKLRK